MFPCSLDRYYTPAHIARQMVEACDLVGSVRCLDTACGDGSLLAAAKEISADVQCMGIDVDGAAITRLRRKYPSWVLSCANALSDCAWRRANAARLSIGCELALLNPPFSMTSPKGIFTNTAGYVGRCSIAMAHLLVVLGRARPQTCCAIVPESLLSSDLDKAARIFIKRDHSIAPMQSLLSTTFQGGRANATVIKVTRSAGQCSQQIEVEPEAGREFTEVKIIRGGLPIFQSVTDRGGLPYVHSTDLGMLARGGMSARRVKPLLRGVVSGDIILLPRVGLPSPHNVRALKFESRVQLSDCVVALCFESSAMAMRWEAALFRHWRDLVGLYRGTGARYVTVDRLRGWLASLLPINNS